jgi:thiamine kinase-like enzyme
MSLAACLPADLRGPTTTITRIAAGLSGAGVSHNDVNPTNLVYDGENLLLLDWDTAGSNDPFYDLAAISVYLCMDDDSLAHDRRARHGIEKPAPGGEAEALTL